MTTVFGRSRFLGLALLAATFAAGALAGAAVDRVLSAEEPERARRDRDDQRSYVIDEVEMSTDQRAAIDSILERRSDRMRTIWRETRPQIDAITDSARTEIMDVLTPEQRADYERRLDERRSRRGRDGGDSSGSGDGG